MIISKWIVIVTLLTAVCIFISIFSSFSIYSVPKFDSRITLALVGNNVTIISVDNTIDFNKQKAMFEIYFKANFNADINGIFGFHGYKQNQEIMKKCEGRLNYIEAGTVENSGELMVKYIKNKENVTDWYYVIYCDLNKLPPNGKFLINLENTYGSFDFNTKMIFNHWKFDCQENCIESNYNSSYFEIKPLNKELTLLRVLKNVTSDTEIYATVSTFNKKAEIISNIFNSLSIGLIAGLCLELIRKNCSASNKKRKNKK
jgi:hypothetical protein